MLELVLPWVIVGLFALFVLSLLKKWWRFALACLVIMVGANLLTQSFALHFRGSREVADVAADSIPPQKLKVLTFNIDGSQLGESDVQKLHDFIIEQHADIVLLVECFGEGPKQLHEMMKGEFAHSSYGVVSREQRLYSNYPIESATRIESKADKSSNNYRYDISAFGTTLHLYGVHFASNNRDLNGKDYSTPDEIEDMEQLKGYIRKISHASAQRKLEASAIADDIRSLSGGLRIVMGDFNDVCGSAPIRLLQLAGMHDAWWRGGLGYGATYRKLPFRIDHIMYAKRLKLQGVARLRTRLSDHNALSAIFIVDNSD